MKSRLLSAFAMYSGLAALALNPVCAAGDLRSGSESSSGLVAIRFEQASARIPAGMKVKLTVTQPLRSGAAKKGDPVDLTVAEDVRGVDGSVLIPAGTPATGTVMESRRAGSYGREGTVAIACQTILLRSGTRVPIRAAGRGAQYVARGRNHSAAAFVTGILAGLVVGLAVGIDRAALGLAVETNDPMPTVAFIMTTAITPAFWNGSNAAVPAGREIDAVVTSDTVVAILPNAATQGSTEVASTLK